MTDPLPPESLSQPPRDSVHPEVLVAEPLTVSPAPPSTVLNAPQYRDRSTALMVFGIIQIILGLLAALMVPFAVLGAFLTRFTPGGGMRPAQYTSAMATYALVAAVLLTLGIGSVQTKRWARALTLVISWYWLITGVLVTVLMTAVLPVAMRAILHAQPNAAQQSAVSAGVMAVILTVIIALAALFLIVIPIAFVVFYGRTDVAETCRYRDPVERWTDRVPLPVLGASVVFVAQALYLLSAGLTAPVFPFFGRYLTGAPAVACFFPFSVLNAYLGWAFLRLKSFAWWIAVLLAPLRLLSMAVTFSRADLLQAYSRLGWSDAQMQMMNSSPLFRSHVVLWWGLISSALFFMYLLWVKRYFIITTVTQRPQPVPIQV